ncbi:MAG: hypothetical protein ACKVX9_03825 [Blastocatellia bacterium]
MTLLLKILSTLLSLAAAVFAIVETLRRGLFLASAIFALAKVVIFLVFCVVLLLVLYLLLTSKRESPSN